MLFADVVATSQAITATRSRIQKTTAAAALLARLQPDEIEPVVAFLSGQVRQGRIGIGWSSLSKIHVAHATRPTLTIKRVDDVMDSLQGMTGSGSAQRRSSLLTDMLSAATQDEADLLRRLLGGEVRQGALEGIAADAIAKAAGVPAGAVRRAMMLGGDLPSTARIALTQGMTGLDEVRLVPLRPIQPMLASTAATTAEALEQTGEASVEWKLDGIRIHAHRSGEDVRVFTRNLNDITERVPEIVSVVAALPFEEVVLDGEAIVRPFFFDILHADGTNLIDLPLRERLHLLDARIPPEHRVPRITTADPTVAQSLFDEALTAGHEGAVVKALEAPYQAGRRGGAWLKVKPAPTLDLVVLGAEWGHGRRQGRLSNLHLGARDPQTGEFVMVGKTFKGLTDALLEWQTERLLSIERAREGIVVWVRSELVVEVALDSAQRSTRYPGGVALRFARVRRYRHDKSPADADTLDAVRALMPGADLD